MILTVIADDKWGCAMETKTRVPHFYEGLREALTLCLDNRLQNLHDLQVAVRDGRRTAYHLEIVQQNYRAEYEILSRLQTLLEVSERPAAPIPIPIRRGA